MRTKTVDQASAEQRLLDAAFRAFAEQDFHGTSARDICERAGANIATANYHFHGNEKLHEAVLEYPCQRIRALRSLPAERPVRQTPDQKLRAGIQSLFQSLDQPKPPAAPLRDAGGDERRRPVPRKE